MAARDAKKNWKNVPRFPFWSHGARTNAVMRGTVIPAAALGNIGGTIFFTARH